MNNNVPDYIMDDLNYEKISDEEYEKIRALFYNDTERRIKKYLRNKNLDKDDILYYIKCVHNEKILPICLTENNILDTAEIKRLLLLSLSKDLQKIYNNNYLEATEAIDEKDVSDPEVKPTPTIEPTPTPTVEPTPTIEPAGETIDPTFLEV
jgi:hypothetical protein